MVENAEYGLRFGLRTRTADSDYGLGLRTRIADSDCGLGRYLKRPPIIMYHYSLYTHIYLHLAILSTPFTCLPLLKYSYTSLDLLTPP